MTIETPYGSLTMLRPVNSRDALYIPLTEESVSQFVHIVQGYGISIQDFIACKKEQTADDEDLVDADAAEEPVAPSAAAEAPGAPSAAAEEPE